MNLFLLCEVINGYIRIPIKGGMTIPNIATFDHGTNVVYLFFGGCQMFNSQLLKKDKSVNLSMPIMNLQHVSLLDVSLLDEQKIGHLVFFVFGLIMP